MSNNDVQKRIEDKLAHTFFDEEKLSQTLGLMSDEINAKVRATIMKTYEDIELQQIYQDLRKYNTYKKNPAHRREIVKFPNAHVYDFVDSVLSKIYGPNWLENKKALKHSLVRPWLTVPIKKL